MVPIDVALSRIRRPLSFQDSSPSPASFADAPLPGRGQGGRPSEEWVAEEVDSLGVAVQIEEPQRTAAEARSFTATGRSRQGPRSPTEVSLNGAASSSQKSPPPSDANFKWARDSYSTAERTLDVWSFVLTLRARLYLLDAKFTYLGGFSEEKQKQRRRRLAAWVRESILQLGPTFIKLGQLSSARSDLLPIEFVEELSKLQDKVHSRP